MDAVLARTSGGAGEEIVLLYVHDEAVAETAHGAFAGLLGRGHPERDPGTRVEHLAAASAGQLLQAAADRLGRPCTRMERSGRVEREVVTAAQGADLLVCLATATPPAPARTASAPPPAARRSRPTPPSRSSTSISTPPPYRPGNSAPNSHPPSDGNDNETAESAAPTKAPKGPGKHGGKGEH